MSKYLKRILELVPVSAVCLMLLLTSSGMAQADSSWELRVCADPDAMPISDRSQTGFENRIAEVLADELGAELTYDWYPFGEDSVNLRFRAGHCDLVMGVPDGQDPFLNTLAYYLSPYVLVYRSDRDFTIDSIDDPILGQLSIGVQSVGSPGHEALLRRGLGDNLVINHRSERYLGIADPLATVIRSVMAEEVDVGVIWGPVAGYYAADSDNGLTVLEFPPIDMASDSFASLVVPMTIGVRAKDEALRDLLNSALAARWSEIQEILNEYAVPRQPSVAPFVRPDAARPDSEIQIGFVGPVVTGRLSIDESLYDVVGEAARNGAALAQDALNAPAAGAPTIRIHYTTAPSAEAAERAARRLVLTDGVDFLIGGVTDDQAAVLADVATEFEVTFLNIGSTDRLLEACSTYHVMPDTSTYTRALLDYHADRGHSRLFVILEQGEDADRRLQVVRNALESTTATELAGFVQVPAHQPAYHELLRKIRESGADLVLSFLDPLDLIAFEAQQSSLEPDMEVVAFPTGLTQSREFLAARQSLAGADISRTHLVLWEAHLDNGRAGQINADYTGRFGRPMDPAGWAAYAAIHVVHEAVSETGTASHSAVATYLLDPGTTFDLGKDAPLSFSSDRRLQQPLYVVQADNQPWGLTASQQLDTLTLLDQIHPIYEPTEDSTNECN